MTSLRADNRAGRCRAARAKVDRRLSALDGKDLLQAAQLYAVDARAFNRLDDVERSRQAVSHSLSLVAALVPNAKTKQLANRRNPKEMEQIIESLERAKAVAAGLAPLQLAGGSLFRACQLLVGRVASDSRVSVRLNETAATVALGDSVADQFFLRVWPTGLS